MATGTAVRAGASAPAPVRSRDGVRARRGSAAPFVLPNLVLCLVFLFYPLVMAFVIS